MANSSEAGGLTLDSDDEAALLRPLAFAEGAGLPLALWVVLARAVGSSVDGSGRERVPGPGG